MTIEIKVPPLPESVADATLVAWHKKTGDRVRRDESLVDLETDKVVLEVPAPSDGVLTEIRVPDGATVNAGEVLALLEQGEERAEEPSTPAKAGAADAPKPSPSAPAPEGDGKMGPAVRALVEEHDLDSASIRGSGREGRIIKRDVLQYLAEHGATTVGIEHDQTGTGPAPMPTGERVERRLPMTRLRARIAERLVEAQRTAAMLTTFNEVDMTAIVELRKRYQDEFVAAHGIKLGFMSFFVRASIEALRQFPMLNASVDGSDIVYHEYFDIGIAVSTERGLLVPILRDAQGMTLADVEKTIADFGSRAQSGEIGMEDLTGGTFTITNGGVFGSMMSTPILNPPQSAILGMHTIQQRAVVVDGDIVARPMMYLALTYDHRIIDGREAVRFLVHLKHQLEDPARLLLHI